MPDAKIIAVVDAIEEVLTSTVSLFRDDPSINGDLATDCVGWTVKDQLSHMVGLEQQLAGAVGPKVELPPLDHVDTELSEYMERPVHARRNLPLVAVVDELAGMTPRCVARYRGLLGQGDPEVASPLGQRRPLSVALVMRAFDLWTHEQDIRCAIGRGVRVSNGDDAGALVAARILDQWSSTLAARVHIDGELRVTVENPPGGAFELVLGDGGPVAVLGLDLAELYQLGCGRRAPEDVLSNATVAGSRDVIEAILPLLAFTP